MKLKSICQRMIEFGKVLGKVLAELQYALCPHTDSRAAGLRSTERGVKTKKCSIIFFG
jgi:hypothetical protein